MYYKSCVLNFKNSSRNARILHYNRQLKKPDSPSKSPESFSQNNLGLLLSAMFLLSFPKAFGFSLKTYQFPLVLNMASLSGKPNATATATQNNPCSAKLEASRATLIQTFNFTRGILIYFIRDILPASIPATLFQAYKVITRSEKDETTAS